MWDEAGLLRNGAGLRHAARVLEAWARHVLPADSIRSLEDRNLLALAVELVRAAIARTESVGAHARSDFPAEVATPAEHREVVTAC
jgi:L-aspartate oxidase